MKTISYRNAPNGRNSALFTGKAIPSLASVSQLSLTIASISETTFSNLAPFQPLCQPFSLFSGKHFSVVELKAINPFFCQVFILFFSPANHAR